jgi:hypothetical protein
MRSQTRPLSLVGAGIVEEVGVCAKPKLVLQRRLQRKKARPGFDA